MKKFLLTVFGLVLVLSAAAFAKPKPSGFGTMDQKLVVTPMAGLDFPTGDFGDAADMGFTVGGGLEYFVHPRAALSFNLGYHSFGNPFPAGDRPDFFLVGAGVRGFMYDDAKLNPYGRVAGGLYQGNSESNTGVSFGAGVLHRMSANMGLFAEGNIHFIFDVGTGSFSSTATFLGVNGGLAITIPTGK